MLITGKVIIKKFRDKHENRPSSDLSERAMVQSAGLNTEQILKK